MLKIAEGKVLTIKNVEARCQNHAVPLTEIEGSWGEPKEKEVKETIESDSEMQDEKPWENELKHVSKLFQRLNV